MGNGCIKLIYDDISGKAQFIHSLIPVLRLVDSRRARSCWRAGRRAPDPPAVDVDAHGEPSISKIFDDFLFNCYEYNRDEKSYLTH